MIEIKTTGNQQLTSKWFGIKHFGPKPDHLLQCITYMNVEPAVEWVALIYLDRDTAYRIEYHIVKKGDTYFLDGKEIKGLNFKGIQNRWMELEKYIELNNIPPRDYKVWLGKDGRVQKTKTKDGKIIGKSDFRCMYCDFKDKCWSLPGAWEDSFNQPATEEG